jgi:hypothetical protein
MRKWIEVLFRSSGQTVQAVEQCEATVPVIVQACHLISKEVQ